MQHFMNNNFQSLNYQKISSAAVSIVVALLLAVGNQPLMLYLMVRKLKGYD